MLNRIHAYIQDSSVRKRAILAFLFGGLSVLGLAPFYFWPIYLLGFAGLSLLLWFSIDKKHHFLIGLAYGFGYFVFGLYWISLALHVDWAAWWWLTPFAAVALPLFLSLYYGIAALLASFFKSHKLIFAIALAVFFSSFEFIRGIAFTGFPWNLPAYIWVDSPLGQNLSWLGAYGLSLFVFLSAGLIGISSLNKRLFIFPALILALLYAYGYLRMAASDPLVMTDKTLMIVQPNIPQIEKWDRSKEYDHFKKILELTKDSTTDYILWPETALTVRKNDVPSLRPHLQEIISDDQLLFTGITDVQATNGDMEFFFYNSLIAINSAVEMPLQYNKHHLVPFGEYVPFRQYISFGGLAQMLSATGDFMAGPGPVSLTLQDGFKISPLICYEVIFPGRVSAPKDRPDILFNVTNDGWYLRSLGPYQHLSMSRARAIESGLPLARSANTGISSLIDPYGRLMLYLPLQSDGTIISSIPQKLPPTPYANFGNKLFFALVFGCFLIMLISGIGCNRTKKT